MEGTIGLKCDENGQIVYLNEESWTKYANCLQLNTDLFFPERGVPTKPAKEICAGCVVRLRCLSEAMERKERFGIWGGLSERERRRVRSQRRRYLLSVGYNEPEEEEIYDD